MRIAVHQMEDRGSVWSNIEAARKAIRECDADFICFPEFFTIPADYKKTGKTVEDAWREVSLPTLNMIAEESLSFNGYVIGGSVVERGSDGYYNTCYIFRNGSVVSKYRKISPVEEEMAMGIRPGREITVLKTEFGNVGVIICADCLSESVVDRVARKCDVLFLPISPTDPSHPKVEGHPVSERIAKEYGVFVVKVSRVARSLGVKSVVMSPEGVIQEASSCCREELFVVEI